MNNNDYIYYVLEVLSALGIIKVRKMFGSYGIYKDGIFFAIVSDDILYFKVDDQNKADYQKQGSQPFSYEGNNKKIITMSYWEVPADIIDNKNKLAQWVEKAVAAAQRAKIGRQIKKKHHTHPPSKNPLNTKQ